MASMKKRQTSRGEARYDVRYRTPTGTVKCRTFKRDKDARTFLRTIESDIIQGRWVDPNAGSVVLATFAAEWLEQRKPHLSPRTHGLYASQLRCHIVPALGDYPLAALTPSIIRAWNSKMIGGANPGRVTAAKTYRLLRTILNTAVADEVILRNPCNIKNAGKEVSAERPMPSLVQMTALAEAVPPERRLLVLLAGQSGMRLSELLALRRRHVDLLHRRVKVEETALDLKGGGEATKGPKSEAGRRTLHLAPGLVGEIEVHLDHFVAIAPDSHLFTGPKGGRLRPATWHQEWTDAKKALSLTQFHFHDLRHLAGTLFAQTGATTKETMRRLGHSTPAAAMRYQHATDERDRDLAVEMEHRMNTDLATETG